MFFSVPFYYDVDVETFGGKCRQILTSKRKKAFWRHAKESPRPPGQSDAPSDWYSGGRGFDPRSGHISFVEI